MDDTTAIDAMIPDSGRWFSVLTGGMLILSSLRRRDLGTGALFAMGGSALVYRGIVGHNGFFTALADILRGHRSPDPAAGA